MAQELENLREQNLKKYRVIVWSNNGEDSLKKYEIAKELNMDRREVYRILSKFESH